MKEGYTDKAEALRSSWFKFARTFSKKVMVFTKDASDFEKISALLTYTAWKVSVFGVILVCIFPHSKLNTERYGYLSVFSSNAGKHGLE